MARDDQDIDTWMDVQNALRAGWSDAEARGRQIWADGTRKGLNVVAQRPNDVRALGLRSSGVATAAAGGRPIQYGALRAAPSSDREMTDLRRRQAEFARTTREIDVQNSWFAAPVLAAPLVAMGLGGIAGREIVKKVGKDALNFAERDRYLRAGDNSRTRAGRRAHKAYEDRVNLKPDWDWEPGLPGPGLRRLKPDIGAPQRTPGKPEKRYYLELKPDTPTGRAAGARAVRRYTDASEGQKVRAIYYNPKDYM